MFLKGGQVLCKVSPICLHPFLLLSCGSPSATLNVVKCAIGAGSFALPKSFEDGGLVASISSTLLVGVLAAYTLNLLGLCELTLRQNGVEHDTPRAEREARVLTYPKIGRLVFPHVTIGNVNLVEVSPSAIPHPPLAFFKKCNISFVCVHRF